MGQQVLAVAGQVVGGYFFGPVGAAIGGAIGGYVGGILFNEDQVFEGPRLSDLRIQTSNYGNAVPIIYGTYRTAGNIIWSTDIRETRLETDVGGKGGGPDTTQVDYQYDLDCAIAFGEPPLGLEFEGIERIYANGVMIYDTRSTSPPATVFASGQWATGLFLYPGNETQLPDPTMEAALGVGNVPAYRGTGYVVITGLQLNVLKTSVLPNFEFIVSTSATVQLGRQLFQQDGLQPPYRHQSAGQQPFITQLSTTIRVANVDDVLIRIYDLNGQLVGTEPRTEDELTFPAFSRNGAQPYYVWETFDHKDATAFAFGTPIGGGTAFFDIDGVDMLAVLPTGLDTLWGVIAGVDRRNYIVLTGPAASAIDEWWHIEWDGEEPQLRRNGIVEGLVNPNENLFNVSPVFQASGQHWVSMMESDLVHIWQVGNANSLHVWELVVDETESPTVNVMRRIISFDSGSLPLRDMSGPGAAFSPGLYADNGLAAVIAGDSDDDQSWLFLYSRLPDITPSGIPLVDILTDLCERSDLDSSELTFTGISDIVDGFAIGQTMTARAAMEVLRPAYYFDAVDSDTFKFVKRGAASVVEYALDDLGAGSETPTVHAVSVTRAQETEIPARVNVKYLAVNADYQVAAQSARRETTGSRETAEVNLPIVFDDDDEVAGIADILLRERWAGAFTRSFASTIEYAKYEPTDVVRLDDGLAVRTVRLRSRVDKGSLIEWESIDEDVEAYDSNAIGVTISVPTQELGTQGQTQFAILDIPPLSETPIGNESAAYVAARGYLPNWPGSTIDVSRNSGATYEPGTGINNASVMGVALTEFDDFLGGNVWDEASTVQVDVGPEGTLYSATHAEVENGANVIVIGREVLQYRTATLVSAGVYDLVGFLRGRKGTEWAISEHAAGDWFVFVSTNLRDLPLQLNDRALDELLVRATTGSTITSAALVRSFEPIIARLMPYSPVHLSATRAADGSWYLTWVRRDRYMNDWDETEVPMSEDAELYDVEVYDTNGVVLEAYTDVNDQFQDVDADVLGGSPTQTQIHFSVFQKSALVGRGFEANTTITQAV